MKVASSLPSRTEIGLSLVGSPAHAELRQNATNSAGRNLSVMLFTWGFEGNTRFGGGLVPQGLGQLGLFGRFHPPLNFSLACSNGNTIIQECLQ